MVLHESERLYIYYVTSIAVMLGKQENKQKSPVNHFLGLQK